jgi:hypothetical protein
MGGPKNSFCHLKVIGEMSFYLNFRAHKVSVPKTVTVFGTDTFYIWTLTVTGSDNDDVRRLVSS